MRIGITLNDVIRDFLSQLKYTYNKYYQIDLTDTEIDSWDLLKFFDFKTEEKLNDFLYSDAPLEIFGHADQLYPNLCSKLNQFIEDVSDDGEHEVIILSRDAHKSRPSTLFFLTKLGFTGDQIKFVLDTSKKWDGIDVLITANPIALSSKPDGKTSVKIKTTYNTDAVADFEFDSILDIISDETVINKILKND